MKFSVIIPAYKAEGCLTRAVESVQAQTLQDFEIIIVDDASPDGTRALAEQLAAQDTRIRVLSLPQNGGPSAARNAGFAAAKGEWLAILDADDAYMPERLEVLWHHATQRGLDMLADNQLFYDAILAKVSRVGMKSSREVLDWQLIEYYENERVGRMFKWGLLKPILRRAFMEKHDLKYRPQYNMGEDALLYGEALACGAKAEILNKAFYVYTTARGEISGQPSGLSNSRYKLEEHIGTYDYFIEQYQGRVSNSAIKAVKKAKKAAIDAEASIHLKNSIKKFKFFSVARYVLSNPGSLYFLCWGVWRFIRFRLPHKILNKLNLK